MTIKSRRKHSDAFKAKSYRQLSCLSSTKPEPTLRSNCWRVWRTFLAKHLCLLPKLQ